MWRGCLADVRREALVYRGSTRNTLDVAPRPVRMQRNRDSPQRGVREGTRRSLSRSLRCGLIFSSASIVRNQPAIGSFSPCSFAHAIAIS
jgi:hypothetical protein